MKHALKYIGLLLFVCVECWADEPTVVFQPQFAQSNILAVLPIGWSIIPQSSVQEQDTKAYFDDPRIEAFILIGTNSNCLNWADKKGVIHKEYLAKECLYIWLVPPDFYPKFPHWWTDPPPLPKSVYSSEKIKVYGLVFQHIANTNRFQTILDKECGGQISWQAGDISWHNWRKDISASLKNKDTD